MFGKARIMATDEEVRNPLPSVHYVEDEQIARIINVAITA
jgi:hypothetical protein